MKYLSKSQKNILLFFTCFALIFWLFALINMITTQYHPQQTIPAFQNNTTVSCPKSDIIDVSSSESSSSKIYHYIKKYDSNIQLVSWHKEKKYTDFYFFSPKISKRIKSTHNFNLQIALTHDRIYFGSPLIKDCF